MRRSVLAPLLGALALQLVSPAPAAADAGYDKGFFIRSDDARFQLKINALLHPRFTFDSAEAPDLSRTNGYAFSLPRARLWLRGHAYVKELRYVVHLDFGAGGVALVDGFVDWAVVPGALHVRVGQMKRPWSRQLLSALPRLQLPDRSRADAASRAGRDLGVMLHNDLAMSPDFEWALGVFNGAGSKPWFAGRAAPDGVVSGRFTNVPDTFNPAVVLRVGYNHGGIDGYAESDFHKGGFRWSLAASGLALFDVDGTDDGERSILGAQVDTLVKYEGLAATAAFFVTSRERAAGGFDQRTLEAAGMMVQAGFLFGEILEPVARYTQIAVQGADDLKEASFGLNVFFYGWQVKWQTEAAATFWTAEGAGPERVDYAVKTQLQLML